MTALRTLCACVLLLSAVAMNSPTTSGPITIELLSYMPGDVDANWVVDGADVDYLVAYMFQGGPAPDPLNSGDVNADCMIDISDVVVLVAYVYDQPEPLLPGWAGLSYRPGDLLIAASWPGEIDECDIQILISYMFYGGPAPSPMDAADVNSDCTIDISDVTKMAAYVNDPYEADPLQAGCVEEGELGWMPGDVNQDGTVDELDVDYLLAYIFEGGPAPDPLASADVNSDGTVDISDVVRLVNYVYDSPDPPLPGCVE